jgi:curved DNA-binding protein
MATATRDPYDVLGVQRGASAEEIRRAYRALARRYHPDVNKDRDAEERFKEVSEAYEILSDPEKRERFDRFGGASDGGAEFGGFEAGDLGDLLETLFGEAGRRGGFAGKGADQEAVLELSLEEAARGGRRTVALGDGRSFDVMVPAGVRQGQRVRLAGQGGAGSGGGPPGDLFLRVQVERHPRLRLDGRDLYVELPVTPWEAALGAEATVPTLGGSARVRVPAGSSTGSRLRLRGQGFPGPRGGHGDLYATVKVMVPKHLTKRERDLFEQLAAASSFDPRKERS